MFKHSYKKSNYIHVNDKDIQFFPTLRVHGRICVVVKKNDVNHNNYLAGFDWDEISTIRGNFH